MGDSITTSLLWNKTTDSLEKKLIYEEEISQKDLYRFEHMTLINVLLDIGDTPFISIDNILPAVPPL